MFCINRFFKYINERNKLAITLIIISAVTITIALEQKIIDVVLF